ncbi:MAG TPA: hypothetical protein VMW56_20405 [Candidatus Margulisiibacteriota bacterium]|nr:hypothetical protein [Candidatus Margulisiibacteriota bacterium]
MLMKLRGSLYLSTVVATLVTPFAASAGTVTTVPLGAAAPALGLPMLGLLAVALSVGAVHVLRRKAASATAKLAVVAVVISLAGAAYAPIPTVVVSNEQCTVRTTQMWDSSNPAVLENRCSNDLVIEAIMACEPGLGSAAVVDELPVCVVGQILAADGACDLPVCD